MKLKQFSFEKFRSIKEKQTFPMHDISVLIGENGGGKTSTLVALELFLDTNSIINESDINSPVIDSEELENLEVLFSGKFKLEEKELNFFKKYNKEEIENPVQLYKKFKLNQDPYYFIKTVGTGTDLDNLDLGRYRKPYEELCDKYEIKDKYNIKEYDDYTVEEMKEKLIEVRNEFPCNKEIEKKINSNELSEYLPKFIPFWSEDPLEKSFFRMIPMGSLRESLLQSNGLAC